MNTSHYPSLELCKKLTEIGFPMTQNIKLFCWDSWYKNAVYNEEIHSDKYDYVCPDIMEMLDVMPNDLSDWIDNAICLIFWKHFDADTFYVCYQEEWNTKTESYFRWTLPNTLAEMVIWLYENNYISFSK